jgi:hypothetical protein
VCVCNFEPVRRGWENNKIIALTKKGKIKVKKFADEKIF